MTLKRMLALLVGLGFLGIAAVAVALLVVASSLPQLTSLQDYKPLLVSNVYSNKGEKIGEFFRERRVVVSYEQIPPMLIKAFIAAEDSSFFEHSGINVLAIMRAFVANLRAGRTVQGGSTITQQVAKSLLLSSEKTYIRKLKEVLLAYRMESHLSKDQIMYLYLNQIYFGQSAYGVAMAAETYFRKQLKDLTIPEMAILAGLPQAPSRYTPVRNPSAAKDRQRYVLGRMAEEKFITEEESKEFIAEPVVVYMRENYQDKAPYYLETVRQFLVQSLGETAVYDEGLEITTSLDLDKQQVAQRSVQDGLRELDKRQGFRGSEQTIQDPQLVAEFLLEIRDALIDDYIPMRTVTSDGKALPEREPLNLNRTKIPEYIRPGQFTKGIVTKVDDVWGLVTVRFAESLGLIDLESMKWARKVNPNVLSKHEEISKPSQAVKVGDVIFIKFMGEKFESDRIAEIVQKEKKKNKKYEPKDLPDFPKFARLHLEQEPTVEGALVAFDLETSGIISMVGGYEFIQNKNEFNRSIQAVRQTGSAFKPIVYAAALDHGFTPASTLLDAPVVYEEEGQLEDNQDLTNVQPDIKKWKPANYSEKFSGETLFRNALIKSLNIPTIKILEKINVSTVATYARRLGIFSPLNMDATLGLGSSGVTLYELTKVFAHFARLGKRIRPQLIVSVTDRSGKSLMEKVSLDQRFEEQIRAVEQEFEEKRMAATADTKPPTEQPEKAPSKFFFPDNEQLISPQTAYLMTSLLKGVVEEGTAQKARSLGRVNAGKTGTTNGYYDAWYVGYTPQIVTGVWVGSDKERTLGRGETGAQSALPIWLTYMTEAHKKLAERAFAVPSDITYANIDNDTGNLASASSKVVARQPFLEGTEPKSTTEDSRATSDDFYKEDLNE